MTGFALNEKLKMKKMMTYWQMKRMGMALIPNGHVHRHSYISSFTFLISFVSFIAYLALFASCSGTDEASGSGTPADDPATLDIYVYAPGQAIPTRGNTGIVAADPTEEKAIHYLQIWVYIHHPGESDDGDFVTYLATSVSPTFYTSDEADVHKFQLPVDVNLKDKRVDVYVLANVKNGDYGLTLTEDTTRDYLENAVLGSDYFGLTTPVVSVPEGGLPMSGVLRDQPIYGSTPSFRIGTSSEMAKVKLARAVSRIRFVFSCANDFDGLKINSVKLDNGMIPDEEYLFLTDEKNPYGYTDNNYNIKGTAYNVVDNEHPAPSLFSLAETAICEDPAHYAWDRLVNDERAKNPDITDQALATAYEALINEGLSSNVAATYSSDVPPVLIDPGHENPRLTEQRVYLRESDKRLTGKIYYQVKDKGAADYGDEKEASFSMNAAGDFSRNHTWIVYAYLSWAKMNIVAVHINKWVKTDPANYTVYNW